MHNLPPYRRYESALAGVEYEMLSSDGKRYYTVTLVNGIGTGCECRHAQYNPTCKHQLKAESLEKAYQAEHTSQLTPEQEKREYAPLNGSRGFSLLK